TLGGNVGSSGGASITKRGVLYALTATNPNPTLGGTGVVEVDDPAHTTGVFSESVSGLIPGSGYSFVAFATNSVGATYTSPVTTFTTTKPTVTIASVPSAGIKQFTTTSGTTVTTLLTSLPAVALAHSTSTGDLIASFNSRGVTGTWWYTGTPGQWKQISSFTATDLAFDG